MKIFKKLFSILLLVCSIAVVFAACSEDPYKDYVSSGLEPKTKKVDYSEQNFIKWNSETKLKVWTSYSDYKDFDVDLDYTEAFFEVNSLLIILVTSNSSDNVKFVDVLENNRKLYPVLESNYIGENDPITDDLIYFLFYVEIPDSGNYTVGKVINKTRTENVMQ